MVTIISNAYLERGYQDYTIRIPFTDLIVLDFDDQEKELIKRANEGGLSDHLMIRILLMIVEKIEKRKLSLLSERNSNG